MVFILNLVNHIWKSLILGSTLFIIGPVPTIIGLSFLISSCPHYLRVLVFTPTRNNLMSAKWCFLLYLYIPFGTQRPSSQNYCVVARGYLNTMTMIFESINHYLLACIDDHSSGPLVLLGLFIIVCSVVELNSSSLYSVILIYYK